MYRMIGDIPYILMRGENTVLKSKIVRSISHIGHFYLINTGDVYYC